MGTDTVHDLTAAYALDALDETERREYEAHLAHCEQCRTDLGSFSEAAGSLAYAVAGPEPPPQLRSRILDRARAERPNVVPLRPRWAVPAAVTAVAAVAATIALAIWASTLSSKVESLQSQRDRQQSVAAVLTAPGAHALQFGSNGRLVVTPQGEAALVFRRLARAPRGMTYEAWVAQGGKPAPAGTFDASGSVTSLVLTKRVPRGARVMVTRERAPGTQQPGHQPIYSAST